MPEHHLVASKRSRNDLMARWELTIPHTDRSAKQTIESWVKMRPPSEPRFFSYA
jgi:hypothetical protein